MLLVALAAFAFAQEEPAPDALPAPEATETIEQAPTEPEAAQEPSPPTLQLGTIQFTAKTDGPVPQLALDQCVRAPTVSPAATGPQDGRLLLQVTMKKGKVSLVSVAETAGSVDWLTPCLKRELAAVEWPVKRGTVDVPIDVIPPE